MIFSSGHPNTISAHFKFCRIVTVALYALLTTATAFAQFTAGIQGNVRDASGGNIPNAQMVLLNTATKVQQSGTSDASGLYRFTNLGPGDYQISQPLRASNAPRPNSR